ncbi:PREDICTED: uncharacterized protein LOC109482979 isoform X1 [Branchiostoma belcheri]|uniref:Uncharacterized protein LOC109482979 isoform X1 n=1 Tax=Branchiostoma belcheri TaxID=7741 RepID=A0A6P4ZX12_BRABE|nr:PREDICTED: uncharacterized protein LOC109482979 isoform X1 [Branchiostoma belcheri]
MALSPGQPVGGLETGMKLNFPEQHAQLAQCLDALRQTGRYCDLTVKVQDKSFSCHRAVLACRTPLFQCLGDDPIVRVDFLHPAAFSALLDYMYTSELTVSSESCSDEDLLATAQALRLHPVVEWLTDYLKAKGAVDKVLEGEGNLQTAAPSSLFLPSTTDNLTSNAVSTLFPRVSQNLPLPFLNTNASFSPHTELQGASTSLGQKQPIESLFFKNTGKSNGATVTTADASNAAPGRDPQLCSCHRCGVHFLSAKVLKQHLAVCVAEVGEGPSCSQDRVAETSRHQRPVFGCSRCSQYFISAKTLQMHLKVCSRLQEYRCSLCQLRFVSQRALDFHTRDCWKSIQEFESPQGSRNTNRGGNSEKPNEARSSPRQRGKGDNSGAPQQKTSQQQQPRSSSDKSLEEEENIEASDSQEVLVLNAKKSTVDISSLITCKQYSCSQCASSFPTPHKLQLHKQQCTKSAVLVGHQQRQKWVCARCTLPFPTMLSLKNHGPWCKKQSSDNRNGAVSDKTAASSSTEAQPIEKATVQEATPNKQGASAKSPDQTPDTSSSVTSEKGSEETTAEPSKKDPKPAKDRSKDIVEKSNKKNTSLTRRAYSDGSSPVLTTLRSSPRHMGRTLRSSPKKPHILSNVAKGNLRIKLMKKVHKAGTSQAARNRRSVSAAVSSKAAGSSIAAGTSKAASSAEKANTTPGAAREKRASEDSPNTAKRQRKGTLVPSKKGTLPNKAQTGKDPTTEHKNTTRAREEQSKTSKNSSAATSTKQRPRVVLRRVDPAMGTSKGSNTISANIDTVIKLEPEDDDSDMWGGTRSPQQRSGRNFGSPETSMFSAQYHCNNCGLSFPQRKAMQDHEVKCKQAFEEAYCQQLSKAAKSHCCQTCLKLFSSDSSLRAHRQACQGAVLYRCKICWEDTDQPKAHMEKHWRWHRPAELRNNPCLSIESDLPLIKSLYMSVVKPNEKWSCTLCEVKKGNVSGRSAGREFRDRLSLWSHQTSAHKVVWRNLTCGECAGSFKFSVRVEYLRHMFANHVELRKAQKAFHCQVCGKVFQDRGLLELHLYRHGKHTAK